MKTFDILATILLIIGGLNWGLVGYFDFNLINAIFGEATAISRVIYARVGLGTLYDVFGYTFGYSAMQHRWRETVEVKH